MRMERWIEIDKRWVVVTGGGERGGNVILQVSIESNEMGIFITEYKCMLTRKPHSVRFWKFSYFWFITSYCVGVYLIS